MIEVEELSKSYGSVVAVDDLSFSVPDGAITGFLGPNGAGKSTAMRCVLGLDRPTAGTSRIDGQPLTRHKAPAAAVGAVLDTSWYQPGRTGLAHLKVVAASAGLPTTRANEVIEAVGLSQAARRRIGGYSLGMKQRLGIATAMIGAPRNLILDEPMNGLDPQGMAWMRAFLRRAAADGHAVLVSSHQLAEMQLVADRLVVVGQGRLIGQWRLAEFLDTHRPDAVIRTDDDDALERHLRGRGTHVASRPDGLRVTFTETVPDVVALSRICREIGVLIIALGESTTGLEELFLAITAHASAYRAES